MATTLDQILAFENVTAAWDHVRTKGKTPGVDDWGARRFARHWEENLRSLIGEVRANTYQPSQLRVRYVPKKRAAGVAGLRVRNSPPDPRDSQYYRRLGIMTIRDRVLQRAALQVLEWRFERKFLACSYGYRPKRSLFKAVAAILHYRERGHGWLLDADIDNCFDSIDHGVLWPLIEQEVSEPPVLRLLEQWLDVGMVDRDARIGISQGMPISPLLCNVILHEMDWRLAARARRALVRYADDFIVLARTEIQAYECFGLVEKYLTPLKLVIEPDKTRITSFDQGFDFLGVHFQGDSYSYAWEDKQIEVSGAHAPPPWALWDYFPHGYEG